MAEQQVNDVAELYVADNGQAQVGYGAATATVAEDACSRPLTVELIGAAVLPGTWIVLSPGATHRGGASHRERVAKGW
jgi:hypothetical protein